MQNKVPHSPVPVDPQNKIWTVIGATGQGKTPFVVGGDYEEGLSKIFLDKGMSTLVVDEIYHHKYSKYKVLHPREYGLLNSQIGLYRTISPLQYMRPLLEEISFQKKVWNTLLVLEDPKKYFKHNFDKMELALLGNSKQQNVDIVFMYWSWDQIPPKLFDMTKYFVVFNTMGGPYNRKKLLGDCYNDCVEAHELVKAGKFVNNRPYYIVPTGI